MFPFRREKINLANYKFSDISVEDKFYCSFA